MGEVREFSSGQAFLVDIGAEHSILGALLNADGHELDCRDEITEIFKTSGSKAFTGNMNRLLYEAFVQCMFDGVSTNEHGVVSVLRKLGQLNDEIHEHVYRLSGSAGGPIEATNAARMVEELYRRRVVSQAMANGAQLVRSGEQDCHTAIADAFGEIATVVEEGEVPSSRFERDRLVDEGLGVILGLRQREPGILYGYPDLDERTTGMHPGHMSCLAARSGGGKTVFGMNVGRDASNEQDVPTVVFSLEMGPGDLLQRSAAAELEIPYKLIQENRLDGRQRERIYKFAEAERENKNFRIEFVPGATAGQIYLLARKAIRDMGARLIIVDYAQSVQADRPVEGEGGRMEETVPRIHDISTKLGVHVLLLAQLKKPQVGREEEPPGINDIRYGTKIENTATTVILTHRKYHAGKPGGEVEAHTVKNRNGTLGDDDLIFDGERMRFLPPGARVTGGNGNW